MRNRTLLQELAGEMDWREEDMDLRWAIKAINLRDQDQLILELCDSSNFQGIEILFSLPKVKLSPYAVVEGYKSLYKGYRAKFLSLMMESENCEELESQFVDHLLENNMFILLGEVFDIPAMKKKHHYLGNCLSDGNYAAVDVLMKKGLQFCAEDLDFSYGIEYNPALAEIFRVLDNACKLKLLPSIARMNEEPAARAVVEWNWNNHLNEETAGSLAAIACTVCNLEMLKYIQERYSTRTEKLLQNTVACESTEVAEFIISTNQYDVEELPESLRKAIELKNAPHTQLFLQHCVSQLLSLSQPLEYAIYAENRELVLQLIGFGARLDKQKLASIMARVSKSPDMFEWIFANSLVDDQLLDDARVQSQIFQYIGADERGLKILCFVISKCPTIPAFSLNQFLEKAVKAMNYQVADMLLRRGCTLSGYVRADSASYENRTARKRDFLNLLAVFANYGFNFRELEKEEYQVMSTYHYPASAAFAGEVGKNNSTTLLPREILVDVTKRLNYNDATSLKYSCIHYYKGINILYAQNAFELINSEQRLSTFSQELLAHPALTRKILSEADPYHRHWIIRWSLGHELFPMVELAISLNLTKLNYCYIDQLVADKKSIAFTQFLMRLAHPSTTTMPIRKLLSKVVLRNQDTPDYFETFLMNHLHERFNAEHLPTSTRSWRKNLSHLLQYDDGNDLVHYTMTMLLSGSGSNL
ncbi:hypothetical protein BJ742DRAFT_59321 [Cladochytrium replicatum]|nr:hypothetical protein BJ742DRAFT_59321 [Cladochytrium replicatum]